MSFLLQRIYRLTEDLGDLRYRAREPVHGFRFFRFDERPDPNRWDSSDWPVLAEGQLWGGHRAYYGFEATLTVPEAWDGQTVVFSLITGNEDGWDATNPQFGLYIDGELRQGMDTNHGSYLLAEEAEGGRSYRLQLSAYSGDEGHNLRLDAELKWLDRATERYYYDLAVPLEAASLMQEDSSDWQAIIGDLNDSVNLLDLREPYSDAYFSSLKAAQDKLTTEFYEGVCGQSKLPTIYAVGHTHIDVAWLWTLAVTEDKSARSFATVLQLMREYPEYKFMSSQAQLYKYVEKNEPELFRQIQERVKEGRWEVEGAMFVEADCNISSGEALVRQIVYGKRYFKETFGVDCQILWLPDVFGYAAALPQILQQARVPYFMTTKISWNETNQLPYDTFNWEGIDGSRVLTHFIPAKDLQFKSDKPVWSSRHFTTYNGYLNANQTMGSWQRYQQKGLNDFVLMAYGHGDGGGGTTRDMIENGRRLEAGLPGVPRVKFSTAGEFFQDLDEAVGMNPRLPVWKGELYLEYHRGTYTSMARNKRSNRKGEFALQNLEFYSMLAGQLADTAYPDEVLEEGWEILLRNQFHDILPGSSIKEVYDDSDVEYARLQAITEEASALQMQAAADAAEGEAGDIVVFNPTGFEQRALVTLPEGAATGEETQVLADGSQVILTAVPPHGYSVIRSAEAAPATAADVKLPRSLNPEETVFENAWYAISFDKTGAFAQVYDKRNSRNMLKAGQSGNVLMSYEDRPHNYENWDINDYYQETSWPVDDLSAFELTEEGPPRSTIRIERRYLASTIVQQIHLYQDNPRIDIETDIDWQQHQILLKAHFPVDVYTNEVTCEIQYGSVKRQTTRNTSWDQARFETVVHKWMDLAEYDYGVAFLNESKFGVSVDGQDVGLTLLKSGQYPNPEADQGSHHFVYSLLGHRDSWQEAGVVAQAYSLNNPLAAVVKAGAGSGRTLEGGSLVSSDEPACVVEVVKKAMASNNLIVRVYEAHGSRVDALLTVTLGAGRTPQKINVVNLLEEVQEAAELEEGRIRCQLDPFEIRTYEIVF